MNLFFLFLTLALSVLALPVQNDLAQSSVASNHINAPPKVQAKSLVESIRSKIAAIKNFLKKKAAAAPVATDINKAEVANGLAFKFKPPTLPAHVSRDHPVTQRIPLAPPASEGRITMEELQNLFKVASHI